MAAKVVIYVTNYCPFCRLAEGFLRSKNVKFDIVDVTNDDAMRDKIATLSGQDTVPQIFADGVPIGGYNDLVAYYRSGKTL